MAYEEQSKILEWLASEHWLGGSHSNGVSFGLKEKTSDIRDSFKTLEQVLGTLAQEGAPPAKIHEEARRRLSAIAEELQLLGDEAHKEQTVAHMVSDSDLQPFEMESARATVRDNLKDTKQQAQEKGVPVEAMSLTDIIDLLGEQFLKEGNVIWETTQRDADAVLELIDDDFEPSDLLHPKSAAVEKIATSTYPELLKLCFAQLVVMNMHNSIVKNLSEISQQAPAIPEKEDFLAESDAALETYLDKFFAEPQPPTFSAAQFIAHEFHSVKIRKKKDDNYQLIFSTPRGAPPEGFRERAEQCVDILRGTEGIEVNEVNLKKRTMRITLHITDNPELQAFLDQRSRGRDR